MFLHETENMKNNMYQLQCNHYPIQMECNNKFSDLKRSTKDNVEAATNKKIYSNKLSAWSCMNNPKMRTRPRVKQAVDCREKGKKIKTKNKRTSANYAKSVDTWC